MDDETRRRGTACILPVPHKGRRSGLYRILSMVLVALMVLGQPLESFGASATYRVTFYDSVKKEPEEGHEINGRYCHAGRWLPNASFGGTFYRRVSFFGMVYNIDKTMGVSISLGTI